MTSSEAILITDEMPILLPMRDRSPGLHVSSIIKDLCIVTGIFKGDRDNMSTAYLELGNSLEWAIIQRLMEHEPGRYIQLGEMEMDGIFLTVDLYDVDEDRVIEIKLTWMSAFEVHPDDEKFWRYWVQLKAYCKALGTNRGSLRVCFVIGDFRGDEPKYRWWDREFTDQELDENWEMLKRHGEANRGRLEEGKGDGDE